MNDSSFGHWLKRTRKRLGVTQLTIERQAGISRSHLSRIENGGIDLPEKETRDRIHSVLGTSDDDLVTAGVLVRSVGLDGDLVYQSVDDMMGGSAMDNVRTLAEAPGAYDGVGDALSRVESWHPDRRQRLMSLIADMDVADRAERS